jgi:hypothetical protein
MLQVLRLSSRHLEQSLEQGVQVMHLPSQHHQPDHSIAQIGQGGWSGGVVVLTRGGDTMCRHSGRRARSSVKSERPRTIKASLMRKPRNL